MSFVSCKVNSSRERIHKNVFVINHKNNSIYSLPRAVGSLSKKYVKTILYMHSDLGVCNLIITSTFN